MNTFSITELAQFSGIKAHTIRIWEQRYKALKPQRTLGNIRTYDSTQLQRLLNIVSLMNEPYKISELCSMPNKVLQKAIEQKLVSNNAQNPSDDFIIHQLIAAGYDFNETQFEHFFSHAILKYGLINTYLKIIYPLLLRIGMMWTINKIPPSQEHFITHIIRKKLLVSIDSLPINPHPKKCWLLFLNEDEYHDIGLLMAHYLISQAGHKVIYLGANVPLSALDNAIQKINPDLLLFFLVRNNEEDEQIALINHFKKNYTSQKTILVTDPQRIPKIRNAAHFTRISSLPELTQIIKNV